MELETMMRQVLLKAARVTTLGAAIAGAACGGNKPPVARPAPPPPAGAITAAPRPPAPPSPVGEATIVPPEPLAEDDISSASIDELNRNSPLKPVFFQYNSSEVDAAGRGTLEENAAVLKRVVWTITIEGHCDERGSAEYNLALGERRAVAARAYLISLGISGDRVRTVSYGKEFPFDPGHAEAAWSTNRRAHFVITAR